MSLIAQAQMVTFEFPSHTTAVIDQPNEFQLGDWHVTPLRGVIHGPDGSRRLTPKAMDVLLCLAKQPGEVVDRETFQRDVWDGRAFSDDPLNKCIAELRRQLGDTAGSRTYIETIPKRGYRLVANVTPLGATTVDDDRKDRPFRYLRVAALLVLCGFAAVGIYRLSSDDAPSDDIAVAVLPFTSLGETEKQYFADGVHEELIGELSQNESLSVRPRASTLVFRERSRSLVDIANELGVSVIVDGSVRQEGDTVRVAAQLIATDSNENLWAGSIERSLSVASLFSIQHEIAREIAGALNVTLLDESPPQDADIEDESFSAHRELAAIAAGSPVGGSKLVLDGHLMVKNDEIDVLRRVIEPDVRIIHLTRDYFEILRSLETRIIRNKLTDESDDRLAGTRLREALITQRERGDDEQMKAIWVVRDEAARAEAAAHLESQGANPEAFKLATFNDLVRKFLILLNNDLIANDIALAAEHRISVDYAKIAADLPALAEFVGSEATGKAEEIARYPLTEER
ncbi:MAG: winged helix-turn-helix domain-containing protein, partial [Pseudomonadota bacterium]